jgi:hypothetical protein
MGVAGPVDYTSGHLYYYASNDCYTYYCKVAR